MRARVRNMALSSALLVLVAMGVSPSAQAIGTNSLACPDDSSARYSGTSTRTSSNRTSETKVSCGSAVRVRALYTVPTTGAQYWTSYTVNSASLATAIQANPGYPVSTGQHQQLGAVGIWTGGFTT